MTGILFAVPDDEFTSIPSGMTCGYNVVLLNSNILPRASFRTQSTGGGAPREPVAINADLR
jgi:hypothetical protein